MNTTTRYPIMGTVVNISIELASSERADLATTIDNEIADDLADLEHIFSAFNPNSELSRWRSGLDGTAPSHDLATVLTAAHEWQVRSEGRFNPLAGLITKRWQAAAADDVVPGRHEMATLAGSISMPRYATDPLRLVGDCSQLNLNAIAKGYCVDRALARTIARHRTSSNDALTAQLKTVVINAGGDLCHFSAVDEPFVVGVENPLRPYDNEPPLCRVAVLNEALATSGQARRGVKIGGSWFGHCLDPRTGWPVDATASATILAPDAMTADVLATIVTLLSPDEAIRFCDDVGGAAGEAIGNVGCFVVDASGEQWSNDVWNARRT